MTKHTNSYIIAGSKHIEKFNIFEEVGCTSTHWTDLKIANSLKLDYYTINFFKKILIQRLLK